MTSPYTPRGIFCNRTLNMRRIQAIGYDMDYTLVHYRMRAWERHAYQYLKERLDNEGWPVEGLSFDAELVIRGLVIDTELGNVVKANRFGYIKRAFHGTEPLPFERQREVYERTLIDLEEDRWYFLNTLFSVSEACMYMQLVDRLDSDRFARSMGYEDLYRHVRRTLDEAHMEGRLKSEITDAPETFVDRDEDVPLTLLDQKRAGNKILLITNSEWDYASAMLAYCFDPFLPAGMTWRDLFDLSIVGARKPDFFSTNMPAFRVVSDDGLLREHHGALRSEHTYVGANASLVEDSLGLTGEEILYVGDHLFVDVNVTKNVMRWRTALVLRELEKEINALATFHDRQVELDALMREKKSLEAKYAGLTLERQRQREGYATSGTSSNDHLTERMTELREKLKEIDAKISPLAREANTLGNSRWGPTMRTGKDKSLLARQVEGFADIYMSRVSNFLNYTPFAYLRSHRGSLPHDEREPEPSH